MMKARVDTEETTETTKEGSSSTMSPDSIVSEVPAPKRWGRRVDIVVGFSVAVGVWVGIFAFFTGANMGPNKESTSGVESAAGEADAATLAAMDTAAGTPATEPTETFDTRVNDVTVGHFRLGLSLRDVLQATLENQYIPSVAILTFGS